MMREHVTVKVRELRAYFFFLKLFTTVDIETWGHH